MASETIDKRQKANGDFSYRFTIRVKNKLSKTWGKIFKEAVELYVLLLRQMYPQSDLIE